MILFTKLFLAHLIGDFLLQPNKWVLHKAKKKVASKYLYFHVLIHFSVTMLLLWDLSYWKITLIILVSHYLIDLIKLYVDPLFNNKTTPFLIDQALHILVLYACAYFNNLWIHTQELFESLDWYLVTAIFFVSFPAAIVISKFLEPMSKQLEMDHESLPNAGKYIGIMERLFILVFIILNQWAAIGLLITAKSVFRFNDLKESNNRKLTEYILIGTLISFGIALLTGLIYKSL